ncbi:MAG: Transglutaminase-like enzyme putative cysteine protease [Frankiales bacterium]|nr:Transglutaminase-like enzyme putative cysteine protease [Frankiales bacterium]
MSANRSYWKLAPLAGALLFAVSLPVRSPWLAVLAAGVMVLPFVQPLSTKLRFRRRLPHRARVGVAVNAAYVVTNAGRMATPPAVVEDALPGFEPARIALPPLRPGESAELDLVLQPIARSWPVGPSSVSVTQRGWFAGSQGPLTTALPDPPVVLPRLIPWPGPLPLVSVDVLGAGRVRSGEGTDVHSLRAWHPGDPPRSVHWRSTARIGSPMVLEREEEYAREVVLVVADGGAGPEWEDGISRAAWLFVAAARGGHNVRVCSGEGAPDVAEFADGDDWFAALGRVGALDLRELGEHLRTARATGAIAVLTANPALVSALRQISPRVEVVEAVR